MFPYLCAHATSFCWQNVSFLLPRNEKCLNIHIHVMFKNKMNIKRCNNWHVTCMGQKQNPRIWQESNLWPVRGWDAPPLSYRETHGGLARPFTRFICNKHPANCQDQKHPVWWHIKKYDKFWMNEPLTIRSWWAFSHQADDCLGIFISLRLWRSTRVLAVICQLQSTTQVTDSVTTCRYLKKLK